MIDFLMRAEIAQKISEIEAKENVTVLYAAESGSRAWGFESPDSDYDVRFIYARPLEWYLSVSDRRDVLEYPISDDLDINGWDLRKALRLLAKSNPHLIEWLWSPFVYKSTLMVADMRSLAHSFSSPTSCSCHG